MHYRIPMTEDEVHFGRNAWVYCVPHQNYHQTGWCRVVNSHKIALAAKTAKEADEECVNRSLKFY
jgi:hypothetical protein